MTQDQSPAAPDEFEQWLSERHRWLQASAAHLIEKKRLPTDEELDGLVAKCIEEARGGDCSSFAQIIPGTLAQAALRPKLIIRKIDDVQSVNALKDGASLTLGDAGLTVVYGTNGSGKTGFSRIIKHAAGTRYKGDLHSNVFKELVGELQARITFAVDGVDQEPLMWKLQSGPLSKLRPVHIFDSHAATMYVTSENEASYEPSRMRFISSLIKVSDRVAVLLGFAKEERVSKLPALPQELSATLAGKWLKGISDKTPQSSVDEYCSYTQEMDAERVAAEAAMAQKDIGLRLAEIGKEQAALLKVVNKVSTLQAALSDGALSKVIAARTNAATKRTAATDDAKKVFGNAPVEGVGEQSWLELWEQARRFSVARAYPGRGFPFVEEDSRCVLCQQKLAEDAKLRLKTFEDFVCKGLEKGAKLAEAERDTLMAAIPVVPEDEEWILQFATLRLDEAVAKACLQSMRARVEALKSGVNEEDVPPLNLNAIEEAVSTFTRSFSEESAALKDLQKDGKRKEVEVRILELKARQWLCQNKLSIEEECARRYELALLDKAIRLANTSVLTIKNNKLAEAELDAGYQARFAEELVKLGGARLPVKPISKYLGKGRVAFGLELVGAKQAIRAEQILSEGENRIIALAAFLADIGESSHQSPFVFDDPISSLDQDFEERVVSRLVDLAATRQVIVFTHRLSLVALLESAVKKLKEVAELQKKPPAVTLKIETLRSFGGHVGLVSEISVRDSNAKKAVNKLRDAVIPQLRKLIDGGNAEEYQRRAESFCTDFRIVLERCVENILLNDVLSRFRRPINTMGKIGALAKIQAGDCAFIDDLMTRYSVFEHSQSNEFPCQCPEFEVLSADINALSAWIDEFGARAVS